MGDNGCIRTTLIIVNVLFLLAGVTILGLGIWVQVEKGDYVAIADSDTGLTGATLLIVVGAVTALISFVGLLGAIKRNRILLWIFFSVLVVLVVLEVVAVILGFVYRDKVEDEFYNDLKKTINEYGTDSEGVKDAWDWAQKKFECCGVDNYTDWRLAAAFNPRGSHYIVPDSCCKDRSKNCGNFTSGRDLDETKINTKGCFEEFKAFIKDHLLTIGLSSLAFLLVELIVIVLTLILVINAQGSSKVV